MQRSYQLKQKKQLKIKINEDDYADPEQGTCALKIPPANDFND